MRRPHLKSPKLADSTLSGALIAYFSWPFWAMHGGPKAPADLGTVVLAVIGLYGTQKAFNTNKETAQIELKREERRDGE